jgi:hypothetical protein
LGQTNQDLSDRLIVAERERSELTTALTAARSENIKTSSSHQANLQVAATTQKSLDAISLDHHSIRDQLVQSQHENATLEHELANMKRKLQSIESTRLTAESASSELLHLRSRYDELVQSEERHVLKIATLESDIAQLRIEYNQLLLRSRLNDALSAEHEVLKELLGATQDAGPIEKLQCLQWELQNARNELEAVQTSVSSTLKVDLQKAKAALAESLSIRETSSEAARVAFEGMNNLLSKVAAGKQQTVGVSVDVAVAETRLPWLKCLQKLATPASFAVVQSIVATLTRLSADDEPSSESNGQTDDTEVHILKFKLRAMAAQLSRAEKCLLDSSPSTLKNQTDSLSARNLALEQKISAAESSIKTITSDRDDCAKRYSSLISSFSQLSNLNNHIVREVVTLRRKLKAQQASGSSDSVHAEGSRDFDREVEEAASSFSASFNQVVMDAVEGEAFRSAKKRSIIQEQNEHIATLHQELSDLKQTNATLQKQLQDALQAAKLSTSAQQPHSVNVPALYNDRHSISDHGSNSLERTAEEEFLTIRLKARAQHSFIILKILTR